MTVIFSADVNNAGMNVILFFKGENDRKVEKQSHYPVIPDDLHSQAVVDIWHRTGEHCFPREQLCMHLIMH